MTSPPEPADPREPTPIERALRFDPEPSAGAEAVAAFDDARREPEHEEISPGALLYEARMRRGLAIVEVSHDTRINPLYLEALEGDRFELLPAPVYARGFLRSYARYLGLDVEELTALMPRDLPRPAGLEPAPGLRRASSELPRPSSLPPLSSLPRSFPSLNRAAALLGLDPRVALAAGGGILLLVVMAFAISRLGGGDTEAPRAAATSPAGRAAGPDPAGAPSTLPPAAVPPFEAGKMPDLLGVARADAEETLTRVGLPFVVLEVGSTTAPAGVVFDQSPAAGRNVDAGDHVTLIVSSGPPPAP